MLDGSAQRPQVVVIKPVTRRIPKAAAGQNKSALAEHSADDRGGT
jgi:hypothetical protein